MAGFGAGTQQNIDALLDSIGFQYGRAGTEFTYQNVVFFLDSKLRIAKWIYGTDYSGDDVDSALKVAAGESDWIGQHSEWLYTLLLLASSVLCVALVYYLAQLTIVHRTKRETQVAFGGTAIELMASEAQWSMNTSLHTAVIAEWRGLPDRKQQTDG